MANRNEFDEKNTKPAACMVCESMLPDAVDGTLTEPEQRLLDAHIVGCSACSQELGEAQRGAAWLAMLKGHTPQPSAMLLQRILAETTGVASVVATPPMPQIARHEWATRAFGNMAISPVNSFTAWRQRLAASFSLEGVSQSFQPRLAMTASMAFFSIALTLNILGVRLGDVAHTLSQPSSLRRTAANAGASARRNFQNLRVVNVVESRVSDLRGNAELGRFTRENDDQGEPGALAPSGPKQSDPANENSDAPHNRQSKKPHKAPQGSSELIAPLPSKNELQKEVQS